MYSNDELKSIYEDDIQDYWEELDAYWESQPEEV